MVTDWAASRPVARARCHPAAELVTDANSLGPPAPEQATAQRMSPDGVVMFYGAANVATAIAEVEAHADVRCKTTSVGRFLPQRSLRVIDLTDLPDIPSMFDVDGRHRRPFLRFVSHFAEDIARPAPASGAAAMYVPTQIVTEYIRDHVRDNNGHRIDGLIYWSSVRAGSRCLALFAGRDDCGDLGADGDEEHPALLCLDRDSLRTRRRRLFAGSDPSPAG